MITRRNLLSSAAVLTAGATVLRVAGRAAASSGPAAEASGKEAPIPAALENNGVRQDREAILPPGQPGVDYTPVVTPNGSTLPFRVVDGVKVFHLVAEEVPHEFAPGLKAKCWGYNGSTPGPTIEAVEGDRLRFYVTNRLPAPTTVHWHGLRLPCGMDGVNGLTQKPIMPGETFRYEFTLREHGTFMYHPHYDEMTQQALGMMGMFVIHPRPGQPNVPSPDRPGAEPSPRVDRDFALLLSEWRLDPGTSRPNPNEMVEFNLLTMNSKAYPGTDPLVVKRGERVRIRLGNLSAMDHHPIHLHGYQFRVTETDGGRIPGSAQFPANTVLVPVGSTRALEFTADEPGDWVFHCHMTHHTMNQMGHGLPNLVGVANTAALDSRVRGRVGLSNYMTMGQTGMGEMADMRMPMPKNSIAMLGGKGPFGTVDMGGMFTVVKVREGLSSYDDPGDYAHPPGTVAEPASAEDLRRDGVELAALADGSGGAVGAHHHHHHDGTTTAGAAPTPPGGKEGGTPGGKTTYTCPMHPEVVSDKPGQCPKCGMTLVTKK